MDPNTQIQKLTEVSAEIQSVLSETENLVIVDTKTNKGARSARTRIQRLITNIEDRRKELKAPVLKAANLIDSTAKELTAQLEPRKIDLIEKIKSYEDQKEKERLEKLLRETNRKLALTEKIQKYRDTYLIWMTDATIEKLGEIIEALNKDVFLKGVYQEFLPKIKEERDLLISMAQNSITVLQQKEAEELETARQEYRTYFESPECPPDLSVDDIKIAILKSEEIFQAKEAQRIIDEANANIEQEKAEIIATPTFDIIIEKATEAANLQQGTHVLEEDLSGVPETNTNDLVIDKSLDEESFNVFVGAIELEIYERPSALSKETDIILGTLIDGINSLIEHARNQFNELKS